MAKSAVAANPAKLPKRVRSEPAPPPELKDLDKLSPEQLAALLFQVKKAGGGKPLLQLPGYRVEKEIGRGGFGAVYRAVREKDNTRVAIKVLLPRAVAQKKAVEEFLREMQVTAKLKHPNIVRFFEMGCEGSVFFFVMEYCEGGSVADFMRQQGGRLPLPVAKPIMLDALEGLAHAHQQGIVHRDLKPQNILLTRGMARISDFVEGGCQ